MGADDKHSLIFAMLEKEKNKDNRYSYETRTYITWCRESIHYYGEYYFATTSRTQTKKDNSCF